MNKHVAFIATHPIQYHAPFFKALAADSFFELTVFFCHKAAPKEQSDAGFGVEFDWDLPLLEGYRHKFLHNVSRNPSASHFFGLDTPEIKEIIAGFRFEAVVINGWNYKTAWQAMSACWRTKTPVMVRSDSHLYTQRRPLKRLLKRGLYRSFIPRFDACLPVGQWSREYFLYYGARPDRIFNVPHVIDDSHFRSQAKRLGRERQQLRDYWKLEKGSTVFLFAGKFTDEKRPMDFIKAIMRAHAAGAAVSGLMVGDGALRPSCQDFAERNRVPVRFAGFMNQSEIARAYTASDMLILPSAGETWGLVVNEAMACGVPCIVSSEVGCGPDMIVPGRTGDIFPFSDIEALSRKVIEYARDKPRLAAMRASVGAFAEKHTVRQAVDGLREAISSVSGRNRQQ